MKIYIALLRGINVSGQKKIPMADLRTLMQNLGFENVKTYIQSGNVVFKALNQEVETLQLVIQEGILKQFGFEVSVLVKTQEELEYIFNNNPLETHQVPQSYFTLLQEKPDAERVHTVSDETYDNETFIITESCVYFYSDKGYGNAKCNNNFFERKLKVSATTRNFKTMQKLLSLCSDL
ncbi:DUF1697 domain-containing protein [Formosa sp. S-31]|uniref:DUF1697 domain-containing protein n=1 Tax=Formosa sp. S-31 TaxID=2790949 RepID=UPI003EBC46CC